MKRMVLPRFTLRSVLLAVTFCAFAALVLGQAVAGRPWAIAASVALGGAAFFFLVHALFFVVVQALPFDSTPEKIKSDTNLAGAASGPPAPLPRGPA